MNELHPFEHVLLKLIALYEDLQRVAPTEPTTQTLNHAATLRPAIPNIIAGRPVLTAVLTGPTGAGKSTLFNSLTNASVPAGCAPRPRTFSAVAAIPDTIMEDIAMNTFFPGYSAVRPLTAPSKLEDPNQDNDVLFYFSYPAIRDEQAPWLVLCDSPDFNSVAQSNWQRAEKMAARADITLFATHTEAYKNERTIDMLKKCARVCGRMMLLFTKCGHTDATIIYNDLLSYVATAPDFSELRPDGRSLSAFIAQADVLFSDRIIPGTSPRIEQLQHPEKELSNIFHGIDGSRLLMSSLLSGSGQLLSAVEQQMQHIQNEKNSLQEELNLLHELTDFSARHVAATYFPLGRLLQQIIITTRATRPRWLQKVFAPLAYTSDTVMRLFTHSQRIFRWAKNALQGETKALQDRTVLEQQRIAEEAERLVERLRAEQPSRPLSAEKCRTALLQLEEAPLPAPKDDWSTRLDNEIRDWIRTHRLYSHTMTGLNELLLLTGGTAVVIDLLCTGGGGSILFANVLTSQLGLIGAAGGTCLAASIALKLFEEIGLGTLIRKADQNWQQQRSEELADHLWKYLVGPLQGNELMTNLKNIEQAPFEEATETAAELAQLLNDLKEELYGNG